MTVRRWPAALLLLPAFALLGLLGAALLLLFEQSFEPAFTLKHYAKALTDSLYLGSFWLTFKLSFYAMVAAVLLGYPIAYSIARARTSLVRNALIMLVAVPFLTNLIVRLYALTLVMSNTGLINTVLRSLGFIRENDLVPMLRTELGVAIGLCYFVLPFVVFTLVGAFSRLDVTLEEAAQSLGADPAVTFLRVTLPLSMPGVIGAAMLAFILSVSAFATPLVLGSNAVPMIANKIYDQVMFADNKPFGSALAVIALVLAVTLLYAQGRATERRRDG
jgi:ABC-type spermidine/putrescine transport system permease subunit I